jgi:monoamine oxidase
LLQLCEGAGLPQEAIEFLAVTSGEETLRASAATETLREEFEETWSSDFDKIVGGTDRLASAFAARLASGGAVALQHLARVHPQIARRDIVRETRSWSWDNHPYSSGATREMLEAAQKA